MSEVNKNQKLVQTKTAQAQKYERLAQLAGSAAKRKHYLFHAERYRQQAENLTRG